MTEPAYRLVRAARPPAAAPMLDDAQRAVVDHESGPLLVLAGPGTGKTTTLVECVVARVARGVPVEHILMVTFSRRAAGEMRDRVTARLGRTMREPIARTLHSYAFGVLRMANVARGLPAPRLFAGPEQDIIVRELLAGTAARWPDALRPALAADAFAGELRDLLMRAVERGLDGRALSELGRRRGRADWIAAGEFLQEYHHVTAMQDPGGYDPAELIRGALRALEDDPRLLAAERGQRRRIFVDEYQDTDPAQAELLALLADGADEVVLVGDPDQSIYAFRGADESAVRDAGVRFGVDGLLPTVALSTSRRSGAVLLAATRRVAERLPGPAAQRALVPADGLPAGAAEAVVFRSASEEAAYLAGTLRRAHLDGLPWSRMAVLVRSTTTAMPTIRRALITAGVPVAVRGDDLPLADQPAVAALLDAIDCVLSVQRAGDEPVPLPDDVAERLLLGPIGGADAVYLRRLRRVLRQLTEPAGLSPSLAAAILDAPGAAVLPEHVRWPVHRVASVIAAGVEATRSSGSPEDVLWAVWQASGLARRWEHASRTGGTAGAAADRDLDAIVELFDAAARYTDRLPHETIAGFAAHIAAQQIPGDPLSVGRPSAEAVAVLTAHASKGLEWDLVCVANVQEGVWPDLRRRGSLLGAEALVDVVAGRAVPGVSLVAPQLAEERRLFYVAVTRARQRVVVSAVSGDEEQPSRFLDELDPVDAERPIAVPPRGVHLTGLVAELRSVVCDPRSSPADRRAAAESLARLAGSGVPGADPSDWWGLGGLSDDRGVADPGRPVPVSPSTIDAFLRCELRALLTGLGAKDGDQISASLGTLVHAVAADAPPGADLDEFQRLLDAQWHTLDFGAPWFAANERIRAGAILARLVGWLRESRRELSLVAVEADFTVDVGDARLRGRVDRLERDSAGRLVVVDYKTGKSKPKPADLPKHPQLAAYQLAVDRGGFDEGTSSGGAMLVQLATGAKYVEQRQEPLADSDEPGWIEQAVTDVAARLRGSEFSARIGPDCRMCDLKKCCPLQPDGQQVTA
ncbi:MAG TPA: ATP-dependent DNA helicase [Jatrophihabitans sp.]|nr:ATP-dependent DNA helicase [Jatrophihabitans sp.]